MFVFDVTNFDATNFRSTKLLKFVILRERKSFISGYARACTCRRSVGKKLKRVKEFMHEKYLYDFQQFGTSSGSIFKMKQYLNSEIYLLCIGRITFFKKQLVNEIFDIEHIENFCNFQIFFYREKKCKI